MKEYHKRIYRHDEEFQTSIPTQYEAKIGDQTYSDFIPKVRFDVPKLEEVINKIELSDKHVNISLLDSASPELWVIQGNKFAKFESSKATQYFFPFMKGTGHSTGTVPTDWLNPGAGASIWLMTGPGLITSKFNSTADTLYLAETTGKERGIYHNAMIDLQVATLASTARINRVLNVSTNYYLNFAIKCAERAIEHARGLQNLSINPSNFEMIDLYKDIAQPNAEYEKIRYEELKNFTYDGSESYAESLMKAMKSVGSFSKYLSEHFPSLYQRYVFARYEAARILSNKEGFQPYEKAVASLVRLDIEDIVDPNDMDGLKILIPPTVDEEPLVQETAKYASEQKALLFLDDLSKEFGEMPSWSSPDQEQKLRALRLWNAGQRIEIDWQVEALLTEIGAI